MNTVFNNKSTFCKPIIIPVLSFSQSRYPSGTLSVQTVRRDWELGQCSQGREVHFSFPPRCCSYFQVAFGRQAISWDWEHEIACNSRGSNRDIVETKRDQWMAVCVSQAVLTSAVNNVTWGFEDSEQSMTTGTDLMPECGRLVFRGVELAYLNINGKKMLPLAEMLALVFRSTPRTTLFTRMEKIKARRYFCQPLEIKMLKKVNGIHGSSANCTLISKEDVERYCSIYMDSNSNGDAASSTDTQEDEETRTDQQMKEVGNVKSGKEAQTARHRSKPANCRISVKDIHIREINKTGSLPCTQSVGSNNAGRKSDADKDGGGNLTSPLSSDEEHRSNSTQTISMLSWVTKKQANTDDDLEMNKNLKAKRTKKLMRAIGGRQESNKFNSTSGKGRKFPKEKADCISSGSTTTRKSRKRHYLSLSLDSGFSDDSGFTSLTFEDYISPTKVQKLGKQAKLKTDKTSPSGPEKQKKNKRKDNCMDLTEDLNLSPPPLVIKKLQNTWLVETKLDSVKKALYEPETGKKSFRPINGVVGTHSAAKAKSLKKMKRHAGLMKPGSKAQCTGAASRNGQCRRRSRSVADAFASEVAAITAEEFSETPERKKNVSKKGIKKVKATGKLGNGTASPLASQGGETAAPSAPSKPLKHAAPAGTKLTPVKPPILRATPNFSFMDLFPSTPGLVIRDNDLCPEFTMACPNDVAKPPPSHPIWKWRLGGPVIAKTHRVNFKIRKIKQPNLKNKPADDFQPTVSSRPAPSP